VKRESKVVAEMLEGTFSALPSLGVGSRVYRQDCALRLCSMFPGATRPDGKAWSSPEAVIDEMAKGWQGVAGDGTVGLTTLSSL
jgi:hypothetical protein